MYLTDNQTKELLKMNLSQIKFSFCFYCYCCLHLYFDAAILFFLNVCKVLYLQIFVHGNKYTVIYSQMIIKFHI